MSVNTSKIKEEYKYKMATNNQVRIVVEIDGDHGSESGAVNVEITDYHS